MFHSDSLSFHEKRPLDLSVTVAWFSLTNHNSLLRIANNEISSLYIDNRIRQTGFRLRLKILKKSFFCSCLFFYIYKTNTFRVALRLFKNRSQKTSKCGKDISDTRGYRFVCHFFLLTTFDFACDLLLNRRTSTWNLLVNCAYLLQQSK